MKKKGCETGMKLNRIKENMSDDMERSYSIYRRRMDNIKIKYDEIQEEGMVLVREVIKSTDYLNDIDKIREMIFLDSQDISNNWSRLSIMGAMCQTPVKKTNILRMLEIHYNYKEKINKINPDKIESVAQMLFEEADTILRKYHQNRMNMDIIEYVIGKEYADEKKHNYTRRELERLQTESITSYLIANGYRKIEVDGRMSVEKIHQILEEGTFIVDIDISTHNNNKVQKDIVVHPFSQDGILFAEAKTSDKNNSGKRLSEEVGKGKHFHRYLQKEDSQCIILCGGFTQTAIKNANLNGIRCYWEHDLDRLFNF